jgi:plastocyanin
MKYLALLALLMVFGCTQPATTAPEPENTGTADVTFVITGENFKFFMDGTENPTLNVKQGDRVRIEFTTTSGFHDWVVDEFNAKSKQVGDGQSSSVEFVADKKGTYEYYCSVGTHRQMGMKGQLIVS